MKTLQNYLFNAIIGWYDNSMEEYHGLDDPEFIEKVCGNIGMSEEDYYSLVLTNASENCSWNISNNKQEKPNNVKVRKLTGKDHTNVSEMDEESGFFVAQWLEDLEADEEASVDYGLFLNGNIIGYCTLGYADDLSIVKDNDSHLLSDVYIKPAYRHKGYGSMMVTEAIKQEYDCILHPIYLTFLHDDLEQFYKPLGFSHVPGTDNIMMKSALKSTTEDEYYILSNNSECDDLSIYKSNGTLYDAYKKMQALIISTGAMAGEDDYIEVYTDLSDLTGSINYADSHTSFRIIKAVDVTDINKCDDVANANLDAIPEEISWNNEDSHYALHDVGRE